MRLSELTAYAEERFGIREQHNWADLPGFSVLCHPRTGKWVALLMRQWDSETGAELERCDLKCGRESLSRYPRPYLIPSLRMQGSKWIDVIFDDGTESDVVFRLFDQAVAAEEQQGYTVVLDTRAPESGSAYHDTALPFSGSSYRPAKEKLPERLREMRHLYEYGRESAEARAKNFYRQAVFMQEYEDDAPWTGDFTCYFPTYHDLTVAQLRGYFTWRTRLRKGNYEPVSASFAYIYIYELLNGVGAAGPEDVPAKLKAFETGFLDAGFGDKRMRQNLRRWMLEYAVLHDLPPETAKEAAPEMAEDDEALLVLKTPEEHTDEEVFRALCTYGGPKTASSPVLAADPERGRRLFSAAWRAASAYREEKKSLFSLCFGRKKVRRWYPFSNAVVYVQARWKDREYVFNEIRSYACKSGVWQSAAFDRLSFDKTRFSGFLHATDAKLRRYLKTGRYLKEDPAYAWAVPYIDAVIAAEEKAREEAARPKIEIDLSGLDRIRRDAETTRDSLLTEEETDGSEEMTGPGAGEEITEVETENAGGPEEDEVSGAPEETALPPEETVPDDIPLDAVEIRILRTLLRGGDVSDILREGHRMPSIAADFINEALYDEIGDSVLVCEDDRLSLVEDYIDDLKQMLGENDDG